MRILLILAAAFCASAQTVTITGPAGNFKAGQVVPLTINITGGSAVAATQGVVSIPAGWAATCSVGSANSVNKTAACNVGAGGLIYVVYGANTIPIVDGTLLNVMLTIPVSVTSGNYTVPVASTLGASPIGDPVPVGVTGSPFAVNIISSPCDVTGDGLVNSADLQAIAASIINAKLGADLNGDGKTDSVDLQRVAVAVAGGACRTGA